MRNEGTGTGFVAAILAFKLFAMDACHEVIKPVKEVIESGTVRKRAAEASDEVAKVIKMPAVRDGLATLVQKAEPTLERTEQGAEHESAAYKGESLLLNSSTSTTPRTANIFHALGQRAEDRISKLKGSLGL